MKRFISGFLLLACTAGIAASASAADHPLAGNSASAAVLESNSEQSAIAGDWYAVADQSGRAYNESPNLTNEFNLATAYMHTGQNALAIPLLLDSAANGQFTQAKVLYDYRSGQRPARIQYNVADEANRRLAILTGGSANTSVRLARASSLPAIAQ